MIRFLEEKYSWSNLTLSQFLDEGNIPSTWIDFFNNKQIKHELNTISEFIDKTVKNDIVYPPINYVFRIFYMIPLEKIKVIIIGQDCYHNGTDEFNCSAMGISFSVNPGNNINPSLNNIYKELENEGYTPEKNGNLINWAKQGVFLLNKALTVTKGKAGSHISVWNNFTKLLIEYISKNKDNIVWLLFGKEAHNIEMYITNKTHNIIKTSHPSPYSYLSSYGNINAFYGSNCFKKTNDLLRKKINW